MPEDIKITASVELTPSEFVGALDRNQQLALLRELCGGGSLRIAEIREIVNSPGYDD